MVNILKRIYNKLERFTSKSSLIVLFLLAHSVLLLMMVFTFPRINAKMGTPAFDLRTFGYTQEEATMMIQNLDQATIEFYTFPQLFLLDILYPLFLALFLSALIIRLMKLIHIYPNQAYSNLFILPFIAMINDYIENIMIWVIITQPSGPSSGVIKIASFFTQMKGIFTMLSWVVILILLIIWLKNKWTVRNI